MFKRILVLLLVGTLPMFACGPTFSVWDVALLGISFVITLIGLIVISNTQKLVAAIWLVLMIVLGMAVPEILVLMILFSAFILTIMFIIHMIRKIFV